MARQSNIRGRIIEASRQLFFQYGFTKVTTDEIAEAAGISKKTLYQYFESKEKLILDVMHETGEEMFRAAEAIFSDPETSLTEKLRSFMELRASWAPHLKQPLINDAQRNYPGVWRQFEETRNTHIRLFLDHLIEQGIKQKVFKKDVDRRMLELVFMGAVNSIMGPESLSRLSYSLEEAQDGIIKIVFTGVLTDKARDEFESYMKKSQNKK